jgi:hypothetical protein
MQNLIAMTKEKEIRPTDFAIANGVLIGTMYQGWRREQKKPTPQYFLRKFKEDMTLNEEELRFLSRYERNSVPKASVEPKPKRIVAEKPNFEVNRTQLMPTSSSRLGMTVDIEYMTDPSVLKSKNLSEHSLADNEKKVYGPIEPTPSVFEPPVAPPIEPTPPTPPSVEPPTLESIEKAEFVAEISPELVLIALSSNAMAGYGFYKLLEWYGVLAWLIPVALFINAYKNAHKPEREMASQSSYWTCVAIEIGYTLFHFTTFKAILFEKQDVLPFDYVYTSFALAVLFSIGSLKAIAQMRQQTEDDYHNFKYN